MSSSLENSTSTSFNQERLQSPNTFVFVLPNDFNYMDGNVIFYPLGGFTTTFLDPKTGDLLDDVQAGPYMVKDKKLTVYAPHVNEGDSIFVSARYVKLQGLVKNTVYYRSMYVFESGKWVYKNTGMPSIADASVSDRNVS